MLPDELAPEAHEPAQTFYEVGPRAGSTPATSTKVGFTLRNSSNRILRGFSFFINPQGLDYSLGSRSQLFATKGGFYVDDFGPAPSQIQLRQLVATGKVIEDGYYTAREDVQRFLKNIYLPATAGPTKTRYRVFFHDHHFERGFEQHVYFPPNSLSISRAVDLHNLWRLELQMISLEKYPYAEIEADPNDPRTKAGRAYTCKAGDTLHTVAARLAGGQLAWGGLAVIGASPAKVARIQDQILKLNPFLKKSRVLADGRVGKPMILHAGEVIRLPA